MNKSSDQEWDELERRGEAPSEALAAPHAHPIDAVAAALAVDPVRGLTAAEAAARLVKHGPNELASAPPEPWWKKFLAQFKELVVLLLIAAAIISGVLGEWIDTGAILAIVLLNGILGFLQEARAEQALAALQKMAAPSAKVFRNGQLQSVPARALVPGDRILLEAGDYVTADARLATAFGLTVQEAALTGESTPVEKDPQASLDARTALGDRLNMVYMGTVVVAGKSEALVVATGMATELGHIAGLLGRQEREPTPLQRRLEELGRVLIVVCLAIVALIFVLQLARGGQFVEVFMMAVSLAVAAVPEGLPAVVTLALAIGLQRMVRRHALVRKLPSVETLGSVTVICSDKTGTLTRNEMTVRAMLAGDQLYDVTGTGYAPHGEFRRRGDDTAVDPRCELDLRKALQIGALCNNAALRRGESDRDWTLTGDPTEGALLVALHKGGLDDPRLAAKIVVEVPFDSQRKMMSVVADEDGRQTMYTKGAPEILLSHCRRRLVDGNAVELDDASRKQILEAGAAMAAEALRVLAVAYRPDAQQADGEWIEDDLVFAGLAGMIDPPRDEARTAVARCYEAGIRPVMITGDHPDTATAIARELAIASPDSQTVSGRQLDEMSDDELRERVASVSVYARVSAEHKLRVVEAWKARRQIVAMTGDGVNDAPAVKAADIGIAMGIAGTDVTKEAADMVLTDDNFASIVSAVEEGRGIFDNIQKFVTYLLSCNAAEVLFMLLAVLVGWPMPLLAVQILWVNLVTDGLPALALGMEPPEKDVMRRPPRPPREGVITRTSAAVMLSTGLLIAALTAVGFHLTWGGDPAELGSARTMAFAVLAFSQLSFSFACRSQKNTLPQLGLFTNPYLLVAIGISATLQLTVLLWPPAQRVFDCVPLTSGELALAIGLGLVPVTVIEVFKLLRAKLRGW